MGRAPRRGSLAMTSGRPASVERLCGGGRVADMTMATGYEGPAAMSRCTGGAIGHCTCRVLLWGVGVVRAAREVGEGDFLSSTYRRDHHQPPIGVAGGEPNPSVYVKEDIAGRDRLLRAAGGVASPAFAGP